MKRLSTWLAWIASAAVATLAAINWATLTALAPLNLLVTQVQAPLGVVLLCMTAVLVALFVMAHLRSQIGSMLEIRRLLKEVQRARELANEAEASRIKDLSDLIHREFRLLEERLGATPAVPTASAPPADVDGDFRPTSLTDFVTGRAH
jgi:uncharacterized integral membrane protein